MPASPALCSPPTLVMLALLRDELGVRLARSFPSTRFCSSWDEVEACCRFNGRPVLFLDPFAAEGLHERVAQFTGATPAAVVVLYTRSDPGSFQASLPFVRAGITDVVLAGVNDSPMRLARLLQELETRQPMSPLFTALRPQLERLPCAVADAVALLFRQPARLRSVDDLAHHSGVSRRTLFRSLKGAGITSARLLVAASRVSAAHQLLRDPKRTVAETASLLGYSSPDQLREHFVALTGHAPAVARERLLSAALNALIVSRLSGSADSGV